MTGSRKAALLRVLCVLVALLTCNGNGAQLSDAATGKQTGQAKKIEVTGCLYVAHDKSGKDEFSFFSREPATLKSNQLDWRLTGNIAALPKHSFFVPMRIRGIEKSTGVVEVIQAKRLEPVATMNKSLDDGSTWHSETNEVYGVRFALPTLVNRANVDERQLAPSFPRQDHTDNFLRAQVSSVFPKSNVSETDVAITANTAIDNRETCEQFESEDPAQRLPLEPVNLEPVNSVRWIGAQSLSSTYSFHSFRNELCYDISFYFDEIQHLGASDTDCVIPVVTIEQELSFIRLFLSRVSFFKPKVACPVRVKSGGQPRVTSYAAVPHQPDKHSAFPYQLFSWTTENTDYVQLSYKCSRRAVISEGWTTRWCGVDSAIEKDRPMNHSPNSSAKLSPVSGDLAGDLKKTEQADDSSLTVILTPFRRGRPYPSSSKSITVVSPGWKSLLGESSQHPN